MTKSKKIRDVENKIDDAFKIINNAIVEYRDTSKGPGEKDTIGLKPSALDAVMILFHFFACKRLTDLNKFLPNLFNQKIFMDDVIEPSISHKDLKQFLFGKGLFADPESNYDIKSRDLISLHTPQDLADLLQSDSLSDAIFGVISETKKTKSIIFRQRHEIHGLKNSQKEIQENIERKLHRGICAFLTSTLTWEELQKHDQYLDELIEDIANTFDHTVNMTSDYLSGWGSLFKYNFRKDGLLGSPAINELGSSKKEDLNFIRFRLDKFKKKEIFDIFSTLDFSPANFTRYEFDKISVGFLDSYLSLKTSPENSQEIRKPNLREKNELRDDTRVLKLALQLLNIKKNDSILLRGCNYLNYVFENTSLSDNVSSLVLNPDPTTKEIDKYLENPNFSNQLQIILNENSIINKLRLLLLGLPISLKLRKNNLNEELGYSQTKSELVVAMKGADHLYSVRSILDSKYESQADIVLFQFPDEGGGLNFPKYVYESELGFTKRGVRGNKIPLSQTSPTEANILSSISQLVPSKGRMGMIVHDKFLSNKRNKALRKLLINKDLIEAIVEINFNKYRRNIKKENQTIIILNLDKSIERKNKYLIASIDIDECDTVILFGSPGEEEKDRVAGKWDRFFEWLLESYTKYPQIHQFETAEYRSNVVGIDDFRFNDYDLSAGRYKKALLDVYKQISNSGTHHLGEICEIVNGVNLPTNKQMTINSGNLLKIGKKAFIVRPGNLSANHMDPELLIEEQSSYNFFDTSNLTKPPYQRGIITEQSILIKLTGHDIKPTKFDPNKELYADEVLNISNPRNIIFINQNIAAIKIKEEYKGKIDFDYLYCVIVETIGLLHTLRNVGKTQRGISISELGLMGIPIPEKIEEQHLQVREKKLSWIEDEEKRRRLKEEGQGSIELKDKAEFELSSFINHEGGRKIQRMNTKLMALQDFIEKHGLGEEPLQAPFPGQETQKVTKAIKDALDSSKQLHELLANISDFCKGEIKPEDLVLVDIERVFKEKILTLQDRSFSIHFSHKGNNKFILLEETWFTGSMENLISNAKTHGFLKSNDDNIIEFKISDKNLGVIIDYKNNGRPLPEDINEEIYLRLGEKGHDSPGIGMGGAFINKMLEAHRAEFTIIRKNTEGVHFQFYFPNNFNSD
jgi:hypothetical protein